MNESFKGVYAVAVTPFCEDGTFDIQKAKTHLDWLIDYGISGICILGATGEYQSVDNAEHMAYVSQILPYIRNRAQVIVGVTRERPDDVITLMNHAETCGVSAAMLLPPFYCHPNQQEILENYRYIIKNTSLPIVLYNNPCSAGVDIQRDTLREIMKFSSVQVLKESSGDVRRLTEAVIDAPSHVSVFCGCDNLALESFAMGAAGWISMAANFAPRNCEALWKYVQLGQLDEARQIYCKLLPALNLLEHFEKPAAAIKYILKRYRGLDLGHMRRPRLDLTPEEQAIVDQTMDFDSIS